MENIIETKDLVFYYEDEDTKEKNYVLKNINLTVKKGQFVTVLGHNGSGKSTLAKQFSTILLPCGGKVYVAGMDTSDEKDHFKIHQNIGMVFQNPDNQIVATIVEEEVAFAPENLGIPREEIRKRVDDALNAVGMYEFRNHDATKLSGGQKQRIAIAGVIAMQPSCIVLDEPTAMLDPKGRKEVISTIKKLNKEKGITIVLITHFMNEAARSERVVVMNDGEILLDGTPREVFMNVGLLQSIGLDVPQATELMFDLRKEGIRAPFDVLTSDECTAALMELLGVKEE